MSMPGGWTMPMTWMRMPGQTWPGAAASFVGMWTVMMIAMMLPSLVPMLWRYRRAIGAHGARLEALTALAAAGYFLVWAIGGFAVFTLGSVLGSVEMRYSTLARTVPIAVGVTVMVAGAMQLTAWKARVLACCRGSLGPRRLSDDAGTAWRHGLRLGTHCTRCCFNLMLILAILGLMDLVMMTAVTAIMTAERIPGGDRVARVAGAFIVAVGLVMIARAVRLA